MTSAVHWLHLNKFYKINEMKSNNKQGKQAELVGN